MVKVFTNTLRLPGSNPNHDPRTSYGGGRPRSNDVVRSNSNTKRQEKETRDTMTQELSYGGGHPRSNEVVRLSVANTEGDSPKKKTRQRKKNSFFPIFVC